jgi:hypothetical protein
MPATKLTPQQQRERKQKIMLAVLGVVLVAVLGFQLPKLLGGKASPSAAAAGTTSAATVGTSAGAPAAASFASASVVAAVQPGGLSSFSRFASKNPFKSQVSTTAGSAAGEAATTADTGTTPAKKTPPAPPVTFAVVPPTTATSTDSGPLVPAVVIKLNGVRRVIPVGSSFPLANPVFTLESIGKKAIWISLIGGSFAGGQKTIEIMRSHPLKLVNATANLSYLIRLIRVTTAPMPQTPRAATTSATTTAGATTASTTTAATTSTTTGP